MLEKKKAGKQKQLKGLLLKKATDKMLLKNIKGSQKIKLV